MEGKEERERERERGRLTHFERETTTTTTKSRDSEADEVFIVHKATVYTTFIDRPISKFLLMIPSVSGLLKLMSSSLSSFWCIDEMLFSHPCIFRFMNVSVTFPSKSPEV